MASDPERAKFALGHFGALFRLERTLANAPRKKRERLRQKHAAWARSSASMRQLLAQHVALGQRARGGQAEQLGIGQRAPQEVGEARGELEAVERTRERRRARAFRQLRAIQKRSSRRR